MSEHPNDLIASYCASLHTHAENAKFEWENGDRGPGFTEWLEKLRTCVDGMEQVQERDDHE